MNKSGTFISELYSIRNRYGKNISTQKLKLLNAISNEKLKTKRELQSWYDTLLFLLAYPDNRPVFQFASQALQQLQLYIQSHETIKERLFNSGIAKTNLCAAFSFEIVKWLRKKHPKDIWLSSFEADDGQIQSILSVVMSKVESEILQDANSDWRSWLKRSLNKGEDILDKLIAIFDETDIRPEVRDELWNAIGVNVEIHSSFHLCLPRPLFTPYFHRSLIRKKLIPQTVNIKFKKVKLNESEAEQIIE